ALRLLAGVGARDPPPAPRRHRRRARGAAAPGGEDGRGVRRQPLRARVGRRRRAAAAPVRCERLAQLAPEPRARRGRRRPRASRARANTLKAMEAPRYRATFVRLLRFLWPYRASLGVSVVLAIGSQAAALALPWLSGSVVGAIRAGERHRLPLLIGLVVAVGSVRALMMVGRRLISGRQALAVELDLRNAVYARLVRLSFGYFDRHQTGQLMSRATVDLQSVRFF